MGELKPAYSGVKGGGYESYPPFNPTLKVVGNAKGGGSGGWLLFEDAFGPWRSITVYFLILPSSSPQRISVSCL